MAEKKAPTPGQLAAQAQSEINQQIANETAGLQGDVASAQGGMNTALEGIEGMFGNLMPAVQGAASFVSQTYQNGLAQEQSIFAEAAARLEKLKAQRMAEAQQMAQTIGGPVNTNAFLSPLNTSLYEMPHMKAGGMLHANALMQGGVQEMEAFAGRVFPLMRVEQETQIRNQFTSRITELQDEIARIRATASDRTTTRLDQLTTQQKEFELAQARLALDRLNADRDWRLSQAELKQREAQLKNDRATLLGYYDKKWRDKKGKLHTSRIYTLGGRSQLTDAQINRAQVNETVRSNMADEALDQQTIDLNKIQLDQAAKANADKIRLDAQSAAVEYINAFMTPGNQPFKVTRYDPVPDFALLTPGERAKLIAQPLTAAQARAQGFDPADATNFMPDGRGIYYFQKNEVLEPTNSQVMNDPTAIYNALIARFIPPGIAKEAVRRRFGLPKDWKPGAKPPTKPKPPAAAKSKGSWWDNPGAGTKPPAKTGTKRDVPPSVVWDPRHKYWYDTDTMKVWLKGHPPGKDGRPT